MRIVSKPHRCELPDARDRNYPMGTVVACECGKHYKRVGFPSLLPWVRVMYSGATHEWEPKGAIE